MEINQCVGYKSFLGNDAAVLARSSGEEPASLRHRAGVASMAWRLARRITNAPYNYRDELLFLRVLALPNASNKGFDSRKTFLTRSTSAELPCEHRAK